MLAISPHYTQPTILLKREEIGGAKFAPAIKENEVEGKKTKEFFPALP